MPSGNKKGELAVERSETERVRPESDPLRHGFAVPPPPKGEALARAESFPAIGRLLLAVDL